MNKFGSQEDPNYVKVAQEVQRMVHQTLYERGPTSEEADILRKIEPKDLDNSCPHEPCMEGTRQDILEQINMWVDDLDAPNILWLKGYPGVGKSAIASTLVSQLSTSKRLGSSFFFQRAKASMMTTRALCQQIAIDLARQYSSIRRNLVVKLRENDDNLTSRSIETLFCTLIQEPSKSNGESQTKTLPVIVIDALDECGGLDGMNSDEREKLLQMIKLWPDMTKKFKLIVTSRRESDIDDAFLGMEHHPIELLAGQGVTSSSSDDIRLFLEFHLHSIATSSRYRGMLKSDWPGPLAINELTKKAEGLFIWAKTVIKFIKGGIPKTRLSQVMEGKDAGGLTDLYSLILNISFPDPDDEVVELFQSVVGTIILARRPLSMSSIAHLLVIDEEVLRYIFTGLQSVLDWGGLVKFNHQSFVDFVLDEGKCPSRFLVKQEFRSQQLALACLHTMKKELQFNICQLKSSHFRNQDVADLGSQVERNVTTHLSYACCFWTDHLTRTKFSPHLQEPLDYFINTQFLYWLEVLSIMKQVGLARGLVTMLAKWMRDNNRDDVATRDMRDFIETFATCIAESTPHIYLSALPFSPTSSWVSKQYLGQYSRRLTFESGGHREWPVLRNVLVGHKGEVTCVVFSPDGDYIISGSDDRTIRLWNADTGKMMAGPFHGHASCVTSVSFSPDGHHIASGSSDKTIRVWKVETGEMTAGPFEGHTDQVISVSFSPDGNSIVSASEDKTILVWNVKTGQMTAGPFEGHTDWITSVSLSPDGHNIVSGSWDQTIRVWNVETGQMISGPFEGHTDGVTSVSFSPDGHHIVSG
ncbi:WD40 repeat-like protein, partial [Serendipita vermifera]